jgi:GTPase SAR1 family protein
VVVTGPTGSGKTTLLYALLSDINNQQLGVSIQTLEDPVEKKLPGLDPLKLSCMRKTKRDMLVPFWYKKSVGIIDTLIDTSTLASLKLIFPSKMPENSKMTWNNYRSGKETGSWSSIPRSAK